MSKPQIEAAMNRHKGMSKEAQEYVKQETVNLQWYSFKRADAKEGRNPIRGTLKEIQELNV